MNRSIPVIRPSVMFTFVLALVFAVVTVATLSVIVGGWMVNWMIPGLKFEFACLVFGQGLLLSAIPLGVLANSFLSHMSEQRLAEENGRYDDEDDEDDGEEAEWLAERISDLMLAKINQGPPKERRYTAAKAKRK